MFTKHPKISTDLNPAQSIGTAEIVQEVKQNDFYAAKLADIAPQAANIDEAISVVKNIAEQAQLRVSINFELNLCVFER